jgi:hypothetical protein
MKGTATREEFRIGTEPVKMPDYGEQVLVCTVRAKPMPTKAIYDAYEAAGYPKSAMEALLAAERPHPVEVLKALEKAGVKQQFTRSALVEAYRVHPDEQAQGQHLGDDHWACDAMPLAGAYDLTPTHWFPAPDTGV